MKIDNQMWNQILRKKIEDVHKKLTEQAAKRQQQFIKSNKSLIARVNSASKKRHETSYADSFATFEFEMLRSDLIHAVNKFEGEKYCHCQECDPYNSTRQPAKIQWQPVEVPFKEKRSPVDSSYRGAKQDCLLDDLQRRKEPEYIQLAKDFVNLKMKVELSGDQDAQALIRAFLGE